MLWSKPWVTNREAPRSWRSSIAMAAALSVNYFSKSSEESVTFLWVLDAFEGKTDESVLDHSDAFRA